MIELERLLALALDELSGEELDRVELHVLSCSTCSQTLERLLLLGKATRELLLAGKLRSLSVVLPEQRAQLDALGLITRRYRVTPAEVVACTVAKDDVYVLTELEADLAGVARVDFLFQAAPGEFRIDDVPFDAASGLVTFVFGGDALRKMPTTRVDIELVAVEGERKRSLGKYVLNHSAGRQ